MFVLQPWVSNVGCKMQSILLSGFRAPDQKTVAVKKCVRWLRGHCQVNADPKKESYMQTIEMSKSLIEEAIDECEYLPVHYVHHLAASFAVASFFHPDKEVRDFCNYLHYMVAEELFHFFPMTKEQFTHRHRDKFEAKPLLIKPCGLCDYRNAASCVPDECEKYRTYQKQVKENLE